MKNKIEIWYLYHSGFAVKTGNKLLIFDYFNDRAANNQSSLYNGVFNSSDFRKLDVYVFVSHQHHDHFNPVIFSWMKHNPNMRLIISSDIKSCNPQDNILLAEPEKKYVIQDINIKTFKSTDEGTAFLIKTDGINLFHSGDLHWWHWDGEPDWWNNQMEQQYKIQIEKLKNYHIDFAFLPVDPRQRKFSLLGLNWFLNEVPCSHVFPMHFADDYSIMKVIQCSGELKPYLSKIHLIKRRGQSFLFE